MQLIFNRKELKFIIDQPKFEILMRKFAKHTSPDKHNIDGKPYPIFGIYFDTLDSELARRHFDKDLFYRFKIRIRAYEDFSSDDALVFLGIKKKVDGISNKRRIQIPFGDAMDFIANGKIPNPENLNPQIVRELEQYASEFELHPAAHISYNRYAFTGENDLRITIDQNIIATNYSDGIQNQLLPEGQYVMEVKATGGIPLWLASALSLNKIYASSFSKYGTSYIEKLSRSITNQASKKITSERMQYV